MVGFGKLFKPYDELINDQPVADTVKKESIFTTKIKKVLKPYDSLVNDEKQEAKGKKQEAKQAPAKVSFATFDFSDNTPQQSFAVVHKLLEMFNRNIRLLVRSKSSSLVVFLGPLILMLLVGASFNTSSLFDLRIATYSESYSNLSNSLVVNLKDQEYNTIVVENKDDCIEGIKLGQYHVCAIFSPDMELKEHAENNIEFYVDKSRINLAAVISNSIFTKVESKSSELSKGLTTELIERLDDTTAEIEEKAPVFTTLATKNSESSLTILGVQDKLNKLDLASDEELLNFSQLNDNLKELKTKNNLSSGAFKPIDETIESIKTGVALLKSKLNDVDSTRLSTVNELNTVTATLQNQLTNINEIKYSLDSITGNIASIEVKTADDIVKPISTVVKPISEQKSHLSFMFPTLLVVVVMFISLMLSSTIIMREKTSKAYFRNFITPTNDLWFMIGDYLTNMFIVAVQLGIILVVAIFFLGNSMPALGSTLSGMSLVLVLASTLFVLMGIFIGYLFKSEETSTLATIAAGSLMLFFSNTILPIESLPPFIKNIAQYNPFVVIESALKKIMLFGADIGAITTAIYILLTFSAIFFMMAFVSRELTKRQFG